jgi:arylsulfatase A-like enzyme
VLYTAAFTTAPVCSPSRSAFMTGMYQTTIGAHNHRSHRDDGYALPEGVRLLTDRFRDAGYFTANVVELPPELGFRGTGKTDWNFAYEGKPFDGRRWSELRDHQPFFAQVNFEETHRPFRAKRRADPAAVDLPPYYPDLPDVPVVRQDFAAYLDAASELDRKVGKILARLEADGLADDTIVAFFADNGQAHVRGKQFPYDSGLRVPLIIRWAKSFAPPAGYRAGSTDDRIVAAIDLGPTLLATAAGVKASGMEGQTFLGKQAVARRYVFGARDRCDETVFRLRTVRDARFRYLRNFTPDRPFLQPNAYKARQYPVWTLLPKLAGRLNDVQAALLAQTMPPEELYDVRADPHETRNLAKDPAHAATLRRLRGELDRWLRVTRDQGGRLEPPEVAAALGATRGGDPRAPAIRDKPPGGEGGRARQRGAP